MIFIKLTGVDSLILTDSFYRPDLWVNSLLSPIFVNEPAFAYLHPSIITFFAKPIKFQKLELHFKFIGSFIYSNYLPPVVWN